ncbi:hypothetical protein GOODEAATRI_003690 [Goodea atripinnis]|uniref:Uncharacterized protein n=1 Tax=Goodea atripinnis TaxID=208336 RepID=A0ABV0MHN3_9TELE
MQTELHWVTLSQTHLCFHPNMSGLAFFPRFNAGMAVLSVKGSAFRHNSNDAYLQQSLGERRSTALQSINSETEDRQAHTLIPKGSVDRHFNLTLTFLDCGRNLERTHICMERTWEKSLQKDPRLGFKPRTFLLQGNSANYCSTVQPCSDQ